METGPGGESDGAGDRVAKTVIAVISGAVVLVVGILVSGGQAGPGPAGPARLATLNAMLNAASAVLLGVGYVCIRSRLVAAHRASMLGAFGVSALFLISYLVHHAMSGSRSFGGQGWIRWVYFPLLISHVVLAAAVLPLVLATLYRAGRGQFARHRRLARWTLPLWFYVSVSGVLVYWMLYH